MYSYRLQSYSAALTLTLAVILLILPAQAIGEISLTVGRMSANRSIEPEFETRLDGDADFLSVRFGTKNQQKFRLQVFGIDYSSESLSSALADGTGRRKVSKVTLGGNGTRKLLDGNYSQVGLGLVLLRYEPDETDPEDFLGVLLSGGQASRLYTDWLFVRASIDVSLLRKQGSGDGAERVDEYMLYTFGKIGLGYFTQRFDVGVSYAYRYLHIGERISSGNVEDTSGGVLVEVRIKF